MAEVSDIRAQIKVRLQTISGLEVYDFVPSNPSTPCAIVGFPIRIQYHQAMDDGLDEIPIPVRLLVANTVNEETTRALETYLDRSGANSVKAAIEGSSRPQTLGGVVSDCVVTQVSNIGQFEYGGIVYLGADYELRILEE